MEGLRSPLRPSANHACTHNGCEVDDKDVGGVVGMAQCCQAQHNGDRDTHFIAGKANCETVKSSDLSVGIFAK